MPNMGLKIVALTDDGTLQLVKPVRLTLELLGQPTPQPVHTPERQAQIEKARQKRREEGRHDKNYPNTRRMAAIRAGVAMKKLKEQAHA
jgi:hypothetical protein